MGASMPLNRGPTPDSEEEDSNAGVLMYQPTPRGKKVSKLLDAPQPSPQVPRSPLITSKRSKPAARSTEIDLTGDSDSDEAVVPTPARTPKKKIVRGTPSNSPTTLKSRPKPTRVPAQPKAALPKTTTLSPAERESLPLKLIRELDRAIFRKSWNGLKCLDGEGEYSGPGLPDGLEVRWSNRLRNTAGRATWKKVTLDGKVRHETFIELATKVTDTEDKLRHTLAHELCHVAAWTLSSEIKPSHGPAFKLWSARVMKKREDITITTTHTYEITFKYRWQCQKEPCGKIFSRHSNSIDITTHGCPCGGRLLAIDADGNAKVPRTPKKSEYQEFLHTHSPALRAENPGISQSEVVKVLAARWREKKERAEREEKELEEAMGGLVL
ncbi:SprT-like domain containing protein [Pseudohyphozyma bogoriensis]|nr:SprT-like domain containing protein [Pseudohyphozyma bogoriensis]